MTLFIIGVLIFCLHPSIILLDSFPLLWVRENTSPTCVNSTQYLLNIVPPVLRLSFIGHGSTPFAEDSWMSHGICANSEVPEIQCAVY